MMCVFYMILGGRKMFLWLVVLWERLGEIDFFVLLNVDRDLWVVEI